MLEFFIDYSDDYPRWKRIVSYVLVSLWACSLVTVLVMGFVLDITSPSTLETWAYVGTAVFFACIPLWSFISHIEIVRDEESH
ncbi:hypothetical protein GCM10023081_00270 [Arthrobacter ginkgonis]|uniref:Uncharacterized protein n=1 Tax=Arthrobacter ginkgonis TaxID=1630594 RepID=A0ABP7BPU1_9MICC